MSLVKLAGLLAAFGLTLGLIGGGVGAVFTDGVTAVQAMTVGTFGCAITGATPASAAIAADGKSVSYTPSTITSSAAGSAPFSFTVQNTGTIGSTLTVVVSALSAPFSVIGAPFASVALGAGATHTYATGVAWTALTNANLGAILSVTWTISCGETPPVQPPTIVTVRSAPLNLQSGSWGVASCGAGMTALSVSTENWGSGQGDYAALFLYRPGDSAGPPYVTYPNVPYGFYTFTPPQEGALVLNDNDNDTLVIVLRCQAI